MFSHRVIFPRPNPSHVQHFAKLNRVMLLGAETGFRKDRVHEICHSELPNPSQLSACSYSRMWRLEWTVRTGEKRQEVQATQPWS